MAVIGPDELATRLQLLCYLHLRLPATYGTEDTTGEPVLTFDPPLTVEEQVLYDTLLAQARGELLPDAFPLTLTPEEKTAIRDDLQVLRDLRQMGRAAFLAQTTAQKERQLYDALVAVTIIDLAVLRS